MKLNFYIASTFFVGVFSFAQNLTKDIPANLLKNSNAVYINKSTELKIKSIDQMEMNYSGEVVILNKQGEDEADLSLYYDKQRRLSGIKVEVIDDSGKVVKTYGRSDFSDYNGTSSNDVFSDTRYLTLNPITLRYPYKVKYSYQVDSNDTAFISDFTPFWNYQVSAVKSTYKIINTSGINFRSKVLNTDFGKVEEKKEGNTWTYDYSNINALVHEPYSPSLRSLLPKVQFSLDKFSLAGEKGDISDWNSFGKWYYSNLLQPVSTITPEILAEVTALKLSGSVEDKVRKIYQYMQDKTRYVSVQMGIGGWKPMTIQSVSEKKYGDCKALTNYTRSLLSAAGIKSYYSVIYSDDSPVSFDSDFPRMGGNHAILVVPTDQGNIWLENTSQILGYNHLSYSTTNRNVLAIKEDGIALMNTPIYKAEQSLERLNAQIKLKSSGVSDFVTQFSYSGYQYDLALRTLNPQRQKETLKSFYSQLDIDNLDIKKFENNRNNATLNYSIDFKVKNLISEVGSDLVFRAVPLYTQSLNKDSERKLPLELKAAYSENYVLEYEAPQGYQFSSIPDNISLTSEFGAYNLEFKLNEGKLIVTRNAVFKEGRYPSEKFNDYATYIRKVYQKDNTQILITKI